VGVFILRILLLVATGSSGYFLGPQIHPSPESGGWGLGIGLAIGVLVILFERSIKQIPLKVIIGGAIGYKRDYRWTNRGYL
jgi:hypothetical protein